MWENAEQATLSDTEREFISTNLGPRLKASRKARGLTQRALAQQAGVSVKYISDIERGRKLPSLATLVKLVDELRERLDNLIGGPEFEALMGNEPDLAKLLSALRHVPAKLLPFVEDLVDLMDRHGLLAVEGRSRASASRSRRARPARKG